MVSKKIIPNMVNVFIRDESDYALLIHNIKHNADRWEFPGGKLENGEKLEERAIMEADQELGIKIKLIKVDGTKILGDYETKTPEGPFLCRTYFAKIIEGEPEIKEQDKHDKFDMFSYSQLLNLHESKILVPNLVLALPRLINYMR